MPMYPPYGGEPLTAGSRYGGLVVIGIVALSVPYQKPGAFGLSGRAAPSGALSAAWVVPPGLAPEADGPMAQPASSTANAGRASTARPARQEVRRGRFIRGPSGRPWGGQAEPHWGGPAGEAPTGHMGILGELPPNNTTLPSSRHRATPPG